MAKTLPSLPVGQNKLVSTELDQSLLEGYHRQLRKVTKTDGAFCSDLALQKLVYLTIQNLESNRAGAPVGKDDLPLEGCAGPDQHYL